jgi:DnaJ family protein B protein 12
MNLIPLLLLIGISLLNALPNLFTTPPIPDPRFSFTPTQRYNVERFTNGLGIRYHVNAGEFHAHPGIAADFAAAKAGGKSDAAALGPRGKSLLNFEAKVERAYKQGLYSQCQNAMAHKERMKEEEIGFMGFGTDWAKVRAIEEEKVASCEELKRLGVIS